MLETTQKTKESISCHLVLPHILDAKCHWRGNIHFYRNLYLKPLLLLQLAIGQTRRTRSGSHYHPLGTFCNCVRDLTYRVARYFQGNLLHTYCECSGGNVTLPQSARICSELYKDLAQL